MGVAVGNEVELLHTQCLCEVYRAKKSRLRKSVSKKCIEDMFTGGWLAQSCTLGAS